MNATGTGVILSAGSINADFEVRVDAQPEPGRTTIGRDLLATSGGKAANVATLAQRLGARAWLVGCVGDDARADQALAGPVREGADVTRVRRSSHATAVSLITVPPDGAKTIVLATAANDSWSRADIDRLQAAIAEAPEGTVVVLDLEIADDAVRAGLAAARDRGLVTVVDPSPASRLHDDVLQLAGHLTPNASEAAQAAGHPVESAADAAAAGRALRERGAAVVHVKLADGGCCVVDEHGATFVRPPAGLDPVDQTGAGDAFAGALAVALLERATATHAAVYGVAASSVAILGYGSQEAYPDRRRLQEMAAGVRTVPVG
jgi:ribokinase